MKPLNETKITFISRSANEGFARAAVAAFAAQLDPAVDELADLRTAVSEAVTNAIVHAYPDTMGKVTMRLRLLEGSLRVEHIPTQPRRVLDAAGVGRIITLT